MTNIFEEEVTTSRTLRNIRKTIKNRILEYGKTDEDAEIIVDELLEIHGLHKTNFDFIKKMETFITEKLNDVSIDDNANKNEKTISGILAEITKPLEKAVGFDLLYRQMVTDWGKKEAKYLSGLLYDLSLAINDSSRLAVPYCFSIDASKIVFEGRPFGQLKSAPPKRVSSYIAALNETVHQLSNHLAGAIAVGSLMLDISHLALYKEKITLDDLKDPKKRKHIENAFQTFVHSVNHLSRNSSESAFTNVSIFDKPKLRVLTDSNNYGWMFEPVEGVKEFPEYVVEYIMEIQKIFLEFFDKGDPSENGMPYRFPVCSINISTNEAGEVADKEYLEYISNTDIYRYNLFVSEGMKIASCCRLINDDELFSLGGQTNSFGGSSISLGSHRVVTLNYNRYAHEANSYEEFLSLVDARIDACARILKSHKNLIQGLTDSGLQPFIKNGWIRMDRLFSTFGFIGMYEANIIVKEKFGDRNEDVVASWLTHLNEKARELSKVYSIVINIEQIPGESMAVRLAKADKLIFGEDNVPFELYANQFIPLWVDANIFERMEVDGKYNKLLTGGGICHFSLGAKVTPKQTKMLIDHAIKCGSSHFALNSVYCKCENGHTFFGDKDKCDTCNGAIIDKLTRIIGYFSPVSSWNKTRREWEFPRRKFKAIQEKEQK